MSEGRISFHNEISRNKRNSIFLMLGVIIVIVALGYVISLATSPEYFVIIMIIAIIFSITYVLISYYNSDKIAIASVNAKPASQAEYRQYHHLVEGLCLASGMPKPKLYIMDNEQINAFASGRSPEHAVICVTSGALKKLDKHELEGVLSHELSHIANYDIRFMTLTAVLVGMVAIISQIFLRSLWFSGGRDDKGKGLFMIIGIALAILAPITVMLVQLAISRKREYAADSSAVKFVRSPTGLIHALEKIKSNSEMKVSGAVAPLFFAKPSKVRNLFETHPPLEDRINRLRRM